MSSTVTRIARGGVVLALIAGSASLRAECLEKIRVGDPAFVVVERCGSPERRERYESSHKKPIEVLRGNTSLQVYPLPPKVTEKWYYETSLNAATVITIEDNGVVQMERIQREGSGEPRID